MLIIILWVAVATFARLIEQTWWSPGSLLGLALALNAIGTVCLAPEYYMSLEANLYLQVLTFMTSFGALVGHRLVLGRRKSIPATSFIVKRRFGFLAFGMVAALASAYFTLQTTGVALADLTSPLGLMRAAQRVTFERYTEGLDFPIFYNVSNALLLAYGMAAAAHFVASKKVEWKFVIPLVVYSASNMLTTARGGILFMILTMILAAVYADRLVSPSGDFVSLRSKAALKTMVVTTGAIVSIFVFFQMLRFGEQSSRSVSDVWTYLRRWPWGSLPGFSIWFDGGRSAVVDTVPGYYTFMGLYDNLGIAGRQQGAYTDFVYLTRGEPGNIYTAFRGFYHDFGAVGTGLFLFGIGVAGGAAAKGGSVRPHASIAVYIAITAFLAYSFVISFWAYMSNLAALLVLPVVLAFFASSSHTLREKEGANSAS